MNQTSAAVLIGLEVLLVNFSVSIVVAATGAMAVTLAARALRVGLPVPSATPCWP